MIGRRSRFILMLPNLLSGLRLVLAMAFPWVAPLWRAPIVIVAGFTDWLDGFIARKFRAKSTSGLLLDACADKLFALSVLLTLVVTGMMVWWEMVLVIARDLAVGFVAAYVALRRRWPAFQRMVPRISGKIATGAQFALFLAMLLPQVPEAARHAAIALTAACSVVAAGDYLGQFGRALRQDRLGGPERGV